MDRDEESAGDVFGRVFASVCDECAVRPHCLGVRREYLDRFGDRGLVPFEEAPEFAVLPATVADR